MMIKNIIELLKTIRTDSLFENERQIQYKVANKLKENNIKFKIEKSLSHSRLDIEAEFHNKKLCIEIKLKATPTIFKQIDKYVTLGYDGIIIVCWSAKVNVRNTINALKGKTRIPVELIEIWKQQTLTEHSIIKK